MISCDNYLYVHITTICELTVDEIFKWMHFLLNFNYSLHPSSVGIVKKTTFSLSNLVRFARHAFASCKRRSRARPYSASLLDGKVCFFPLDKFFAPILRPSSLLDRTLINFAFFPNLRKFCSYPLLQLTFFC